MPPLLALILCGGFVIFLLRLDHKRSPHVTRALWIPTIWMFTIASRPIAGWLQNQRTNPDASGPVDLVFFVLLTVLALAVLVRRKPQWAAALAENKWLVVLLLFMLVSVIWSGIPGTSLKRWLRECQAVLMAFVVLSEPFPKEAVVSLLRRTAYALIPFSIVVIKYFPVLGVDYGAWSGDQMWIGVAQQKNGLAVICIIAAVFLIWSFARQGRDPAPKAWRYQGAADAAILLLAVYLMAGPRHSAFYSATSTYALAAGLAVCAWAYLRQRAKGGLRPGLFLAVMSLVMVAGLTAVLLEGSGIRFLASSAGRDATLTGRTQVWSSLLPVVKGSPLVGRGFGGFWTSRTRELYQISGAHSGYLDVLIGIGAVGLIIVVLFLLSSCRKAVAGLEKDLFWGLLWICFLVLAAVHNVGESSIDTFTSPLSAIILLFAIVSVAPPGPEPSQKV